MLAYLKSPAAMRVSDHAYKSRHSPASGLTVTLSDKGCGDNGIPGKKIDISADKPKGD